MFILDYIDLFLDATLPMLRIAGFLLPVAGAWLIFNHFRRAKQDVQRRVMADPGTFATTTLKPAARVMNRARRSIEAIAQAGGLDSLKDRDMKMLRAKLIQVGYFDRSAVPLFFGLRIVLAVILAAAVGGIMFLNNGFDPWTSAALFTLGGFASGYFLPAIVLDRMLQRCMAEHRAGFPDFMDLMVVCVQAGLSMEAGLQRIAGELKTSYPMLALQLEIATVEIRSGKTMSGSVEAFAKRLGIEEATSFATLLIQSEQLGSSLSQSLRAYSDDMRNKRLMKAEEKAASLPAKLVVPLTLFVFPTLLVVLLLPVIIAVSGAKI